MTQKQDKTIKLKVLKIKRRFARLFSEKNLTKRHLIFDLEHNNLRKYYNGIILFGITKLQHIFDIRKFHFAVKR